MERRIVTTADGSSSIYVPELKEHYHSRYGAINESLHVFIKHGLQHIINLEKREITILEIGFGTGLNAWLSCLEITGVDIFIRYTGLEAHPLERNILIELNYPRFTNEPFAEKIFQKIHNASWGEEKAITSNFSLEKIKAFIQDFIPHYTFDLVYFDAFAPNTQPEMWVKDVFGKLYSWMNQGGVLVTYCSKGEVRRTMQDSGFTVEKLPGPPFKREMLRATKP